MLPDGLPLNFAENRPFYLKGCPQPRSTVQWTGWITSGDRLVSASLPHRVLEPFHASDARAHTGAYPFSSLAMVINAHSKLDLFMRDHNISATPRIRMFAQRISELVAQIFFVPQNFKSVAGCPTGTIRSQRVRLSRQFSGESGKDQPFGEMETEAPEASDTDGLTDSEFHLISEKAQDPNLSHKDRADAAMRMLLGTRRKWLHGWLAFQISDLLNC